MKNPSSRIGGFCLSGAIYRACDLFRKRTEFHIFRSFGDMQFLRSFLRARVIGSVGDNVLASGIDVVYQVTLLANKFAPTERRRVPTRWLQSNDHRKLPTRKKLHDLKKRNRAAA
jgi:hypothetical protein